MATIVDRLMNIDMVCLCPQMDIVALVTRDGALVMYRTTSWQRLMAPTELLATGAISALCWSPDGQQLAVGHVQGALTIFDIEAEKLVEGAKVCWGKDVEHAHKISLMWWAQQVCTGAHSSNRSVADIESVDLTESHSVAVMFTIEA
jgi:WD40 repeat protein